MNKKNKMLILINQNFSELDESIKRSYKKFDGEMDLIFLKNISDDLLENAKNYIEEFKKNNCNFGFVLWITGVAFTNLLTKALKENVIFTTPSQHYYEDHTKHFKKIEVLVLGASTLGSKNIKLLSNLHIKTILENKD